MRQPSLLDALVPLFTLAVLIGGALVLPTKVFRAEFARRGLAPANLSRLAADSGTVTSALVPWNSCGAFMGAVLGVPTLLFAPWAFFNIASPLLSMGYGFTGFRVEHVAPTTSAVAAPGDVELSTSEPEQDHVEGLA